MRTPIEWTGGVVVFGGCHDECDYYSMRWGHVGCANCGYYLQATHRKLKIAEGTSARTEFKNDAGDNEVNSRLYSTFTSEAFAERCKYYHNCSPQ